MDKIEELNKIKKLTKSQNEINDQVYVVAEKAGLLKPNLEPIYDGIFDIEQYVKAPCRIMWIMQEPYDDFDENGNPAGGGWNLWDPMTRLTSDSKDINETWKRIAYYTFGVFSDNEDWWEIPNIHDDKEVLASLNKIALINISKMPGGKRSNMASISEYYPTWKEIIDKQLTDLCPQIIIYANTLQLFNKYEELDLFKEYWDKDHHVNYLNVYKDEINGNFHFSAYHPKATGAGSYGIKQVDYYQCLYSAYKDVINDISQE